MKSFLPFKDKSKSNKYCKPKAEATPASQNRPNNSGDGGLDQGTKSTMSLPSPRSISELYKEKAHNLRVFSLKELTEATKRFSRLLMIGGGGFGSVYKGKIRPANGTSNTSVVAIKRLNRHSLQDHKEWAAEVQFLGVLSHSNLVKLIGYCSVDGESGIQRLLVYEFMANGSLEDHLFRRALPTLPWIKRLKIIVGAAEGLAYLHGGLELQVIYRDFKSSNVLLDEKFQPKLSDFGFAREGPTGDRTHISTTVVGSQGYAAPEYLETGHLTVHCDTWNFGVVLYEIITGRRALERNRPTGEQKLLDWVRQFPADSKEFNKIIDPRLHDEFSPSAARRVAKLADRCLNKNAKDRPTMSQIVESLKQEIQE